MLHEIDGYELIPESWGHVDKINNILIANNIKNKAIQVCARYNYTTAYWMWVTFGDHHFIDEAIAKAVNTLQEKFGPGLPVHNNYELAKTLVPSTQKFQG